MISDKVYSVYMHRFPNNKVYIGMTSQFPKKRWHYRNGYDKNNAVGKAIKQFGWNNVEHVILKDNLSKSDAEYYESYYIQKYKSNSIDFGYNSTNGGSLGTKVNSVTRKKYSEHRTGIKFSKSHRQSLSKSISAYFNDESNKDKIEQMKYNDMINSPKRKSVVCIETNIIYSSIRNAGKLTGIDYRHIGYVCNKTYGRKTAGGYHWEFVERGDE